MYGKTIIGLSYTTKFVIFDIKGNQSLVGGVIPFTHSHHLGEKNLGTCMWCVVSLVFIVTGKFHPPYAP